MSFNNNVQTKHQKICGRCKNIFTLPANYKKRKVSPSGGQWCPKCDKEVFKKK